MRRFLGSLVVALLCVMSVVYAQQSDVKKPTYRLLAEEPNTGSRIRDAIATGSWVPLNLSFDQLSDEHKARLRSQYVDMPETDEPPYPKDGLASIYKKVAKRMGRVDIRGKVDIDAQVNEQGEVVSVKLVAYDDRDAAMEVARVLIDTKFKPGKCAGQPCAMDYPFYMFLKYSL